MYKMDWKIIIVKAENGYICEWEEDSENEENYKIKRKQVFEESDEENGELICMKEMLHFVKEHFGIVYSKHSKHNLVIDVKKEKD
jgi:hypothetical protein